MFRYNLIVVFAVFLYCFSSFVNCHTCQEDFILEAREIMSTFTNCKREVLGGQFAWKYDNESRRLEVLFGAKLDDQGLAWLAWGLNPGKEPQMVGTRALIGIKQRNEPLAINTYNITGQTKIGCRLQPSKIDLNVTDFNFRLLPKTNYYAIHTTIFLPSEYNETRIHHVWQVGKVASGLSPRMHAKTLHNFDSTQTIDLLSGKITGGLTVRSRDGVRKAHGIMNIVGWGTLLPIGVIIVRYTKKVPIETKHLWYRLHVTCQIAGWTIGSIGWGIGLWLGHASKYYKFPVHGLLGTFIFTFTTLQMFALRLKPEEGDEYRKYWNIYHHYLGYSLLATICFNIFKGLQILNAHHLKLFYIGEIAILVCIFLACEAYNWNQVWLEIKKNKDSNNSSSVRSELNKSTEKEDGASKTVPKQETTQPQKVAEASSSIVK